ncbi:MAG: hypothetical protein PHI12_00915 [Dehalococcoidales bacterium]|nr:hypothetical protein [Dehalococcoidales bacterium]
MIRRIWNKINQERGVVLIVVLILLAVGGLTIAPMLSHMSTGLKAGQAYEKKTNQYYAADAGVENALWQITREQRLPEFPSEPGDQWQYPIEDLNGKSITVTIEYTGKDAAGNDIYKINSAASDDSGNTAIESYVTFGGGFAFLLDNAITAVGDVTLMPGVVVNGDIQYNGDLSYNPNQVTINGETSDDPIPSWPTAEYFSDYYHKDVDGLTCVPDGYSIDISEGTEANPILIGPICSQGNLTITGTDGVARLEGTVYVGTQYSKVGDFNIMPQCTLQLNGQTIFAEGNINFQPLCITSGEGCIIAVGDIDYQPNISGEDFVALMSIEGTVHLQPGNDFYGCIIGDSSVELWPHTSLNYIAPTEGGINFPGLDEDDTSIMELKVRTWETS